MKKQILIAALAVIGGGAILSPAAFSHDHDRYYWNRGGVPYGYYNNGYMGHRYHGNRRGLMRELRHERREAIRDERRAIRHWDNRLGRWF